jgi:hypothetical protein
MDAPAKHWVQYRRPWKQGPIAESDLSTEFVVLCRKPMAYITNVLGNTVWLIAGQKTSPHAYFLCSRFTASYIGPYDDPTLSEQAMCIRGTSGRLFRPLIAIPRSPWFYSFRRRHGNFAFGLGPIEAADVAELGRLVAMHDRSGG